MLAAMKPSKHILDPTFQYRPSYATDIRTNKDSGSATNTAMRFAEGKTTVDVFSE
jgi:hypothetical protein